MELDSNLELEWPVEEHSSTESTLVNNNSTSESETTCQEKEDNGLFLIREPEQSELLKEESSPFPTNLTRDSLSESLQLLDHGTVKTTRELPSIQETRETSETTEENASMSMEDLTLTKDTPHSGTATTVSTKVGSSTLKESDIQSNHLMMELNSN